MRNLKTNENNREEIRQIEIHETNIHIRTKTSRIREC